MGKILELEIRYCFKDGKMEKFLELEIKFLFSGRIMGGKKFGT
jgi:hypothetical protein